MNCRPQVVTPGSASDTDIGFGWRAAGGSETQPPSNASATAMPAINPDRVKCVLFMMPAT
jgi:hypothetical protein